MCPSHPFIVRETKDLLLLLSIYTQTHLWRGNFDWTCFLDLPYVFKEVSEGFISNVQRLGLKNCVMINSFSKDDINRFHHRLSIFTISASNSINTINTIHFSRAHWSNRIELSQEALPNSNDQICFPLFALVVLWPDYIVVSTTSIYPLPYLQLYLWSLVQCPGTHLFIHI